MWIDAELFSYSKCVHKFRRSVSRTLQTCARDSQTFFCLSNVPTGFLIHFAFGCYMWCTITILSDRYLCLYLRHVRTIGHNATAAIELEICRKDNKTVSFLKMYYGYIPSSAEEERKPWHSAWILAVEIRITFVCRATHMDDSLKLAEIKTFAFAGTDRSVSAGVGTALMLMSVAGEWI